MEPLYGTQVVVAHDHLAVADLLTETVGRLVWIDDILHDAHSLLAGLLVALIALACRLLLDLALLILAGCCRLLLDGGDTGRCDNTRSGSLLALKEKLVV